MVIFDTIKYHGLALRIRISEEFKTKEYQWWLSDAGNSRRLSLYHGDKLWFNEDQKRWMIWDGKKWKVDTKNEMRKLAESAIQKSIKDLPKYYSDPDAIKQTKKFLQKCLTVGKLNSMIRYAQSDYSLKENQMDSDDWLLNLKNGTFDLKKNTLSPHLKENLITKIANVKYNASAKCPLWEKFLDRIFDGKKDLMDFVKRAVGYSLAGLQKEQVIFLLIGSGANGKSTLLETIREILGDDYSRTTPFDTFLRKQSGRIRNDLARLKGAKFVSAVETERGKKLSEPVVKVLTGEDKITARFLYKEYFEFESTFKIFLAANYKPEIQGTDEGIWRRVRVIPFNVQIPEGERDKNLRDKLLLEREGILNWAIEGCFEWQKDGLGMPIDVKEAVRQYRSEMDTIGNFLKEACITDDDASIQSLHLYKVYKDWCKLHGEKKISHRAFGQEIRARRIEVRKGFPVVYKGIQVKPEFLKN